MINCRPYSPIAWLNDFHTQAALSLHFSIHHKAFHSLHFYPSTDFSHKTHHKLLLFQLLTLQPRVTLKSHNPLTKFSHNSSLPFSLLALCRKHNNTNQEIKFNHFPFSSQEAEAWGVFLHHFVLSCCLLPWKTVNIILIFINHLLIFFCFSWALDQGN